MQENKELTVKQGVQAMLWKENLCLWYFWDTREIIWG